MNKEDHAERLLAIANKLLEKNTNRSIHDAEDIVQSAMIGPIDIWISTCPASQNLADRIDKKFRWFLLHEIYRPIKKTSAVEAAGITEEQLRTHSTFLKWADTQTSVSKYGPAILKMHYLEDITFTEMSRSIGLTPARIGQIHKDMIQRFRDNPKLLEGIQSDEY